MMLGLYKYRALIITLVEFHSYSLKHDSAEIMFRQNFNEPDPRFQIKQLKSGNGNGKNTVRGQQNLRNPFQFGLDASLVQNRFCCHCIFYFGTTND